MDNLIKETTPQLSRKRTQQKADWKCNKLKKERYVCTALITHAAFRGQWC